MASRCQPWEGVMVSICNAGVAHCEDNETVSERLTPEYNELPPADPARPATSSSHPSAARCEPRLCEAQPVSATSEFSPPSVEGQTLLRAKPSEERLQEFTSRFRHMESRQACSNQALEQISALLEVTADKFGTLNEALHQMKTDIGHLHASLSSLETRVSQTAVPYAQPMSASRSAGETGGAAGDDGKAKVHPDGSPVGLDEAVESFHMSISFTSEPTLGSTALDSDRQSEQTSLDVSKISGKGSRTWSEESALQSRCQQHDDALVSLIHVALKHPDLSGVHLWRQWQHQQKRVKSQRELNVDLVTKKSSLRIQNEQFVALVRVATHHAALGGRDRLSQFEAELRQDKKEEERVQRSSGASASWHTSASPEAKECGDTGLRSYGFQPSLSHQQGVVSLVHVALKHPDINGFPLLQHWKMERVNIKSQRQLNLNCVEKKHQIHQQNRQFVALVYAALFYPDLEGAKLLKRWEQLQEEACQPNSPLGSVNPQTFWSRSRSSSPRHSRSESPRPSISIDFDPQKQERLVRLVKLVVDNPELSGTELCKLWRSKSSLDCSICNVASSSTSTCSCRAQSRLQLYLGTMCSAFCSPAVLLTSFSFINTPCDAQVAQ